jgi:hypothetical protein
MRDLAGQERIVAEYPYIDLDGNVLYTVQRWTPKRFTIAPELPPAAQRVLFSLSAIAHARDTGVPLYVVEGERDAVRLINAGIPATTNVSGAQARWLPQYSDQLAGCNVVVVADNDEPGRNHARVVAAAVAATAKSVRLVYPGYGKDISAMLDAGYMLEHLEPLPLKASLHSVLASAVVEKRVAWAWKNYIPLGSLSIIEGDPGDGKSTLTCDLLGRWSSGAPLPDGSNHAGPWSTMMVSVEDDASTTIKPRLRAAGADLDRVVIVLGGQSPELPYNLGVDLRATEDDIRQHGVRILILDPLMALLPDGVNGYIDAEVRRSLAPLQSMAARLDVAVVVVRHLTKSATQALYAGSGSIGIIGAARAAFIVSTEPNPNNPNDAERRLFVPNKSNLVRKPPSLAYQIVEDGHKSDVAKVRWLGTTEWTAEKLFKARTRGQTKVDEAEAWLLAYIAKAPEGEVDAGDAEADAREDGIKRTPLYDAKRRAGIVSIKTAEFQPRTVWRLPVVRAVSLARTAGMSGTTESPTVTTHTEIQDILDFSSRTTGRIASDERSEEPLDPEVSLLARARVCEVCGSTNVRVFAKPWYTIRCQAHDPRSFSS